MAGVRTPVGWDEHAAGVARLDGVLRRPARRLPPCGWRSAPATSSAVAQRSDGRPRRLRARRRHRGRRRRRRGAGDVHLRAPRRGDAGPRPHPAGRAAAAHDHARRRGHRPRHRVDQLPQRAAARVGARDGRAHRLRRDRHHQARRRALRRLPQLLRLARLRHPAPDRARAGAGATSRSGTSAFDDARALADAVEPHRRRARVGRRAGRRRSTGSPSRPASPVPHPRPLDRRARPDQRLHRPAGLLPLDPAAARPTG